MDGWQGMPMVGHAPWLFRFFCCLAHACFCFLLFFLSDAWVAAGSSHRAPTTASMHCTPAPIKCNDATERPPPPAGRNDPAAPRGQRHLRSCLVLALLGPISGTGVRLVAGGVGVGGL